MQTESNTPSESSRRARNTPPTVAEYMTQQIALSGKSQSEIAREAGFNKPNVISMFKQGLTKVPVAKVGPLAKALGVDPLHFYKLVMAEYEPATWAVIQDMILKQPVVSQNEMEIIEVIRTSNVINPKIRTHEERVALLDVIGTFKSEND